MSDDVKAPLLQGDEPNHVQYSSTVSTNSGDGSPAKQSDPEVNVESVPPRELHVYKRRFYILILFSMFSACQNGIWNTFGPISAVAEDMFGWNDGVIALLGNWGPISYVISAIFFSWMMQVKGLRISVLLSSFLIALGTALRCISTATPAVTWLAHIGQFLNGLAGPVAMAGSPVISSVWFPAGQRTTATGFAIFLSVGGLAASFVMGPYLVPERNSTTVNTTTVSSMADLYLVSSQNHSAAVIDSEKEDFIKYMYIAAGAAGGVFLLILVYFPDRPPHSPSMSATLARENFTTGLKNLLKKGQYWQIAFVYGVTQGVLNCWGSVLDVNLKPHGIHQDEAGWIGFYATIGACVGGLLMAGLSDFFIHFMKWIALGLYTVGLGCFLVFTLMLIGVVPASTAALYVLVIAGNTVIGSTCPLLYEMGCECAYPIAEGTANGVLTLMNNIGGLIFMFVLMIPNLDTMWMNWTLVGSIGLSVPVLVFMRDKYNRTSVDEISPLPPPT